MDLQPYINAHVCVHVDHMLAQRKPFTKSCMPLPSGYYKSKKSLWRTVYVATEPGQGLEYCNVACNTRNEESMFYNFVRS